MPASIFHQDNNRRLASVIRHISFSFVVFFTYTCIFVFRKAFTAASFKDQTLFGLPLLTVLVIAQVAGYLLSKFAGIRFISELKPGDRRKISLIIMLTAWLSLLLFAILPYYLGFLCMMLNGFALGFMWGIVFSYVEGRKITDLIAVVLAVSFLFAGGLSRSVGKWLIQAGIHESWMPFIAGAVFALPLFLFYILLEKFPSPDEEDVRERTKRKPMMKEGRFAFIQMFRAGVIGFVCIYLMLTIMRDLRDNYMVRIWDEIGYGNGILLYTGTETISSLLILCLIGSMVIIKNHLYSFHLIHLLLLAGLLFAGGSSWLFSQKLISGQSWMQWNGMGLYLAYILFNSVYFERLLSLFRVSGNVGFLIYLADAWGYLGSVSVMISKEFMPSASGWAAFYLKLSIILCIAAAFISLFIWLFFFRKYQQTKASL
jgi:MFS family permease